MGLIKGGGHCDLKVASSQAKINENFANSIGKIKAKVLLHLKVNSILKIDVTFHKQADSMWGGGRGKGAKKVSPLTPSVRPLYAPVVNDMSN